MWFHINHDHVRDMPQSRLSDPVYVAQTRYGTLIFDVSHRVAHAYLLGLDELPALLFPEPLSKLIVQYAEDQQAPKRAKPRKR